MAIEATAELARQSSRAVSKIRGNRPKAIATEGGRNLSTFDLVRVKSVKDVRRTLRESCQRHEHCIMLSLGCCVSRAEIAEWRSRWGAGVQAVVETWASHCDGFVAFSDVDDIELHS